MNIKSGLMSWGAVMITAAGVFAQQAEYDDMYFNAKDRAKLKANRQAEEQSYAATEKRVKKMATVEEEFVNPTDSYSARNVNPEYSARANAEIAQEDNQDYFVNNYQYQTTNGLNNWNNNYNNWYNRPWYSGNYFGPSINAWNSPYYGYNSAFYSPWYDPYWGGNSWGSSFSFYWGNSWNYGWGGNYNYWNRPYYGSAWASPWGWDPYWGGWGGYRYPVVIVDSDRYVRYGKRTSRSGYAYGNGRPASNNRGTIVSPEGNGSRSQIINGRTSSSNTVSAPSRSSGSGNSDGDQYYNRTWRRVTQQPASTSGTSGSNSSGRTSSSWGNSNGNSSNSWSSPSRSSESRTFSSPSRSNDGGGSRSSGSSGSSSGSRSSRGR